MYCPQPGPGQHAPPSAGERITQHMLFERLPHEPWATPGLDILLRAKEQVIAGQGPHAADDDANMAAALLLRIGDFLPAADPADRERGPLREYLHQVLPGPLARLADRSLGAAARWRRDVHLRSLGAVRTLTPRLMAAAGVGPIANHPTDHKDSLPAAALLAARSFFSGSGSAGLGPLHGGHAAAGSPGEPCPAAMPAEALAASPTAGGRPLEELPRLEAGCSATTGTASRQLDPAASTLAFRRVRQLLFPTSDWPAPLDRVKSLRCVPVAGPGLAGAGPPADPLRAADLEREAKVSPQAPGLTLVLWTAASGSPVRIVVPPADATGQVLLPRTSGRAPRSHGLCRMDPLRDGSIEVDLQHGDLVLLLSEGGGQVNPAVAGCRDLDAPAGIGGGGHLIRGGFDLA
ncbi:hypothetical protein H696_05470 [Fonticula alba]|uniref:Uncharacterized protein n=1 Tax=Fonticula alba TaxID=691883 RepID=A0A058Z172_FONAL|nr:hypothetical protein H696_05470 [Fonticula alba]KCV68004.1 hypothetical protein H696_05470 [Fonticula alba]|eukprot:XP_009497571.1 hypothetical protein H696_05470 [Fonticula alba]